MVDKNIINIRIGKLHEYLGNLETLKKYPLEDFLNNLMIHSTAERQLQLAIECIQDIATHIIADERLGVPETNKDVYIFLSKAGIINNELALKLADMAKFRNILVHDYIELNLKTVFEIIQLDLNDIILFVKHILKYMEKR